MKYFIFFILMLFISIRSIGQTQHIPGPAAKAYFQEAQKKYVKFVGNKDSMVIVLRLLDKALKEDNLFYNAWASKIAFQCQLDEYVPAYQTVKKMAALFPKDIYINLICGALQYKTGHNADGLVSCNKVIKLCDAIPEQKRAGDAYNELLSFKGIALMLMDKTVQGKSILKKLYNNEDNPVIKSRLANYLNSANKNEIIEDVLPGRWD